MLEILRSLASNKYVSDTPICLEVINIRMEPFTLNRIQEENTTPFSRIIEVYQALGLFGHMPDNLTISISEPTGLIEELAPIPWPSEFKNGDR